MVLIEQLFPAAHVNPPMTLPTLLKSIGLVVVTPVVEFVVAKFIVVPPTIDILVAVLLQLWPQTKSTLGLLSHVHTPRVSERLPGEPLQAYLQSSTPTQRPDVLLT